MEHSWKTETIGFHPGRSSYVSDSQTSEFYHYQWVRRAVSTQLSSAGFIAYMTRVARATTLHESTNQGDRQHDQQVKGKIVSLLACI